MNYLVENIPHIRNLKILKIHHSSITDDVSFDLWCTLLSYKPLEEIHLLYCGVGDKTAIQIANKLSSESYNNLTRLDFTDNQIGESGGEALGKALLTSSCKLTYLNLKLNPLRDEGTHHIASALKENNRLIHLNLSGCLFGPLTFVVFGESLKKNRILQKLYLSNNFIDEVT
ncbi:hypothetical protein WDU94_013700 [Cyamophila willieti]